MSENRRLTRGDQAHPASDRNPWLEVCGWSGTHQGCSSDEWTTLWCEGRACVRLCVLLVHVRVRRANGRRSSGPAEDETSRGRERRRKGGGGCESVKGAHGPSPCRMGVGGHWPLEAVQALL